MPDIEQANHKSENPQQANKHPLKAAIASYNSLPIGLRRIVVGTLVATSILVAVTILHPNMPKAIFLTGSLLNLLIVVTVAIQIYIYVGQWDIMNEGLKETKRAAQAAEDSAKIAGDTLRISQRAYVGLQQDPELKLEPTRFPEIKVYFVNTGRIPAHVIEFRYKFSSDKEGFGQGITEYRGAKKDFFIFAGTPKAIHCVWNHQPVDDEWLLRIGNQTSTIYFAGRLAYEDVWGISDGFKTADVIRFEYFSVGVRELRENYKGDQDYIPPEFVVEFDGTEEATEQPPWEPDEPIDYDPFEL